MPELPEVETVRLALIKNVVGKSLSKIIHIREDYMRFGHHHMNSFKPSYLIEVERKGKFLSLHLDSGISIMHHLGMSGRLLFQPTSKTIEPHTHLRIQVGDGGYELQQRDPRRFGFVGIFTRDELNGYPSWKNLGPDPFELSPKIMLEIIHSSNRPIKTLLLDQKKIAGLGNIYVDESLHRAGIHPLRLSGSITQQEAKKLCQIFKTVLSEAIKAGGTSTNDYRHLDGTFGSFQNWLRVYKQEGKHCKHCGTVIEKFVLTGRGTHFCPTCQIITR
jgi:formamidopyrimidine-DNA glycosylase